MENLGTPILTIAGSIITALLTWIGWLIKKRIDDNKANQQIQEELKILISQFIDSQDIILSVNTEIVRGLKIALQSDAIQFKNAHDSGLMNGESVEHQKVIQDFMNDLDDLKINLEKAKISRTGKDKVGPQ